MEHAHELPEFLHFIEEYSILRGFIFGFIHTLIPLIGFYTGWSINRFLKIISNGAIAGIIGIVIAHIIADFIAALADPHLKSAACRQRIRRNDLRSPGEDCRAFCQITPDRGDRV